jgi:hypothetical protein
VQGVQGPQAGEGEWELAAFADHLAQGEYRVQHHRAGRIRRLGLLWSARALFDIPQPPQFLLHLDQQMPVGFPERLGGFAQGVVLAELVRHAREDFGDGESDRLLGIADHTEHRQPRVPDRAQQPRQERGTGLLQVGRAEHRPAEHLAHHPELLVALLGLEPIEREDEAAVLVHRGGQPLARVPLARPQQR